MKRKLIFLTLVILAIFACNLTPPSVPTSIASTNTLHPPTESFTPAATQTASLTPTEPSTATLTPSETPTSLPSETLLPAVESLKAEVIAPLLSCRYGPGPDYLYLFAFRRGAN